MLVLCNCFTFCHVCFIICLHISLPSSFTSVIINHLPSSAWEGWGASAAALLPHHMPLTLADCSERPEETSGVYIIYPGGVDTIYPTAVQVYCDQTTDGGGWTVFLRRQKQEPQLNFSRTFKDYKEGFGSPSGEYWLGLENLHRLTTTKTMEMRAVIVRGVNRASGRYLDFKVEGGDEYTLRVGGYDNVSSSAFDALTYHDGRQFSTIDRDRDSKSGETERC
ncbi:hypothetical protein HAZT_HAZT011589 [Hyalella azteca]|uniref:Fibrinogen C-terminal domain-containing protein n=1 Tax=Hyalella azteca TaxID=294128 RepID=A0A6A0H5R1_HYAAZ|nr:hypothetical protein HAZT_HAZT011589 [Hyalella azteca]